jgi:hypothetical protein
MSAVVERERRKTERWALTRLFGSSLITLCSEQWFSRSSLVDSLWTNLQSKKYALHKQHPPALYRCLYFSLSQRAVVSLDDGGDGGVQRLRGQRRTYSLERVLHSVNKRSV